MWYGITSIGFLLCSCMEEERIILRSRLWLTQGDTATLFSAAAAARRPPPAAAAFAADAWRRKNMAYTHLWRRRRRRRGTK